MEKIENKDLTPEEKRVIVDKGTEKPFTGIYWNHFEKGTFICRNCKTPLYRSEDKFDASCGWPAFDDELPNTVKRQPDKDGKRTEIVCANCGGHLGHIFQGEQFTKKNIRHCVNSISIKFIADKKTDTAIFAAGCFWGVEYHFSKASGVISAKSGYTGGTTPNPTYRQVCDGTTGHLEAVEVIYDPSITRYDELVKLFFQIHDFTQKDGQGADKGEQYLSAVFYSSPEQKITTENIIKQLQDMGYDVATKVLPISKFWKAENYHQKYFEKKGVEPKCHFFRKIF